MRTLKRVMPVLLMIAASCSIQAQAERAYAAEGSKLTAGLTRTVLRNGVTILVKESRANDVVAVQVTVPMGVKYESDKEAGISRLLQQALLKGTKTRTAEQIANEIESAGGRVSASSSKEVGFVQLSCTADGLEKVLDVFFDVILNPVFPAEEVSKEKTLQIRRLRERKDQLLASTVDLTQEVLYQGNPFHKPGEGYEETVATLGRDEVLEAYKRFYRPENLIIAAVGNFDSKKFVKKVEEKFGALKGGNKKISVELPPISLVESRSKLEHKESSSAWIVVAYPAPGMSEPNYLPAQVIDCVFGGSMNSRLFTELRDKKGLGYQVGSFYAGYSREAFIGAYIGTRPDRFAEARDGIVAEATRIRESGITEDELGSAKKFLRGTYIINLESNSSQAANFANNECVGVGYGYADRYVEGIGKVTEEEVLEVSKDHFSTYALGSILPETAEPETGKVQGTEQE